jgi:hypothetical protein
MTKVERWHRQALRVGAQHWEDQMDLFAIRTLVDYTRDVKLGIEPAYSEARHWFEHMYSGGFSLDAVCDLIGLNPWDVQRRVKRMEKNDRVS